MISYQASSSSAIIPPGFCKKKRHRVEYMYTRKNKKVKYLCITAATNFEENVTSPKGLDQKRKLLIRVHTNCQYFKT